MADGTLDLTIDEIDIQLVRAIEGVDTQMAELSLAGQNASLQAAMKNISQNLQEAEMLQQKEQQRKLREIQRAKSMRAHVQKLSASGL